QVVRGSEFNDTFHGSNNLTGVENFQGRGGDDLIDGGGGFDRASYWLRTDDNVTGGITVNMAAGTVVGDASVGTDTLRSIEAARGTNFADTYNATGFTALSTNAGTAGVNNVGAAFNEFEGLGGNDSITGNGNTRISYINATDAVTVDIAAGTAHSTVGDLANVGSDTFTGVNAVQGSYFADALSGSNNAANTTEFFDGGAGNDTIDGRGGFDQAFYNNAVGTVSGISVNMAAGTVVGDTSINTDTLRSIESVRGTNFADTYAATGFGQSGALNIGDSGTFNEFEGLAGNDTITGNGNTRITFVNATGGVTVDFLAGTATGDASVGTDTFTGISQVRGSQFADTIIGDGLNNTYVATVDNVSDTFDGGAGFDTANYSAYSAALTVTLNGSNQIIVQGSGSDDAHSDTIANVENFVGGTGVDTVAGDGFNNTYVATVDNVRDIFDGGAGFDTANYSAYSAALTVTLNGSNQIIVQGSGSDDAHSDTIANVENFTGGTGVDTVTGDGFNNTYSATVDNVRDIFDGGAGFDAANYSAYSAALSVALNGIAQVIVHGSGSDDAHSDMIANVENVVGGFGNDLFVGDANNNTFTGGAGTDQISYLSAVGPVTINLAAGTVVGDGTDSLRSIEYVIGTAAADSYDASGFSGSSANAGSNG